MVCSASLTEVKSSHYYIQKEHLDMVLGFDKLFKLLFNRFTTVDAQNYRKISMVGVGV